MSKADEDLLVLARRGDLGDDESRRLREILASSPDARELYEAGRELDAEAAVVAGDEEMYARIVSAVAARHRAAGRPSRRWIARGALAAILLAAITVGASAVLRTPASPGPSRAPSSPSLPSPLPASPGPSRAAAPPSQVVPAAPIDVAPVPEPVPAPPTRETAAPPAEPTPPVHASRRVEHAPAPAVEPPQVATASSEPAPIAAPPSEPTEAVAPPATPTPTAGELFAAANRARIDGNTREAIERAKDLERLYPTSKEAVTTLVTLGMLYLKTGDAATALTSFDAYRASGSTSMMAEALWGKSQALQALGRAADERTTLEQLVGSYPHSAYTKAAKNRLSALE